MPRTRLLRLAKPFPVFARGHRQAAGAHPPRRNEHGNDSVFYSAVEKESLIKSLRQYPSFVIQLHVTVEFSQSFRAKLLG